MRTQSRIVLVVFLFAALLGRSYVQNVQAETLTIVTYYPSPYGAYNSIRLYPHNCGSSECNVNTEGTLCYDSGEHILKVCRFDGASYIWDAVGSRRVTWTFLGEIYLGALPTNAITTVSYPLSDIVPSNAKEVLIYVYVRTGDYNNPGGNLEFKIYTQEGTTEYAHYFFAHPYAQVAWSYNSDTFWLPLTSDNMIICTSLGQPVTGNGSGSIFLIGYR